MLSEEDFERKLNEPRISSLHDGSKGCGIAYISIGILKLAMVEQVEELRAELKGRSLRDRSILENCEIEIHNARATADSSRRVSDYSQLRWLSEGGRIKSKMAGAAWIQCSERGDSIGFAGREKGEAVLQFKVRIRGNPNREPTLEDGDS